MAEQQQLQDILVRFEAVLLQQTAATDALAVQAATTEARFSQGEANLQAMVATLEARLLDSETKLAAALARCRAASRRG